MTDFATVYAAARCWTKDQNPYEDRELEKQLAQAGAPSNIVGHQALNPCLYFIAAMPLMATIAWLRWPAANILWCLVSLAAFAASLFAIVRQTSLSLQGKWIFASVALLFCPSYVGVMYGNPSVLTASFVALAICLALDQHHWTSGVLIGVALCLKPQIALCGVCVLALWKNWSSLLIASGVLSGATALGAWRASSFGHFLAWWHSQQRNIALTLAPGGKGDPSLNDPWSSELLNGQTIPAVFTGNLHFCDALVWSSAIVLLVLFLHRRRVTRGPHSWSDVGFFCALTTMAGYHRYYDGQLFLLVLPCIVVLWRRRERIIAALVAFCFLLLAFPSQTVLPRLLGPGSTVHLWEQLLLLRHQPLAVVAVTLILVFNLSRRTAGIRGDLRT